MAQKWLCTICDYTYDPKVGDSEGGVAPGTAFEDLPENWLCPDCGARSVSFEQIGDPS